MSNRAHVLRMQHITLASVQLAAIALINFCESAAAFADTLDENS
jgi:hypothetical protein